MIRAGRYEVADKVSKDIDALVAVLPTKEAAERDAARRQAYGPI